MASTVGSFHRLSLIDTSPFESRSLFHNRDLGAETSMGSPWGQFEGAFVAVSDDSFTRVGLGVGHVLQAHVEGSHGDQIGRATPRGASVPDCTGRVLLVQLAVLVRTHP